MSRLLPPTDHPTAPFRGDMQKTPITPGKGGKDRIVPFPGGVKEALAVHMTGMRKARAGYLFESARRRPYSDRGIRKILAKYAEAAGLAHPISPHQLRHFLLT